MIQTSLIPYLKGFVGAIVAVVICATLWTAYTDHVAIKSIVTYLNAHPLPPAK